MKQANNIDAFLTPEELKKLTNTDRPGEQKKVLERNCIRFYTGKGNVVNTTWFNVNNPYRPIEAQNDGLPDFSKFESHG